MIDVIEAARSAGVAWLSPYAFSTENWRRPNAETDFLMQLVRRVVRKHGPLLHARGTRCRFLDMADSRVPTALAQDFATLAKRIGAPPRRPDDSRFRALDIAPFTVPDGSGQDKSA